MSEPESIGTQPTNSHSAAPEQALERSWLVWGVWISMLVSAVAFVAIYGSNVPSWDGWDMVPTVTGHQPVTAQWLWSQHNEHRVPLPRLLLLAIHWIVGINFVGPMIFNVLALGGLALAMILISMRLHGRIHYTDAFFPIILLHIGQAENLLWGWQLQFIASVVISGILLLLIVRSAPRFSLGPAIAFGIGLLLLPLCGANGLALVPALALWLAFIALLRRRSQDPRARWGSSIILGLAASALLLAAFYFVGYESVPYHRPTPGPIQALGTAAEFLTLGFGRPALAIWPIFGPVAVLVVLLSGIRLLEVMRRQPAERPRAAGLLCFLAAMGSLIAGVSLGRVGVEDRYITLAAPFWACVYFIWSVYGSQRTGYAARALLFAAAGTLLVFNIVYGLDYGRRLRSRLAAFEHDMVAGVPLYQLIVRHKEYLHINQDVLTDYLPMLRDAGVGKFRFLHGNPPVEEIALPLAPGALHRITWDQGVARGADYNSSLTFVLPASRDVIGVRLRYSYPDRESVAPCRYLFWRGPDQEEFPDTQRDQYCPTGDRANWERGSWLRLMDPDPITTVWIGSPVQAIRIHPDLRPFAFRISEIVLLVPAEGSTNAGAGLHPHNKWFP